MISRRNFIVKTISASALASSGLGSAFASGYPLPVTSPDDYHPLAKSFPVSVFSKMLHWLNYEEMAKFAAEIGFDGVDLTVRPKGHVEPQRVTEDLPKAVSAIQKAGLNVFMITTAITKTDDANAEAILKTASSLGIKHYRTGWIKYDQNISIPENLKIIEKQLTKLAQLNGKYKIIGEYQNHTDAEFGSPVWDLYGVLKNINSPWLGSQYDIYHATAEAAKSWILGLELLKPYIRTIDVKDFMWGVKDGKQRRNDVPIGNGNVDLKKFFEIIKAAKIDVPVSLHFEYDLGGAESGAKEITMPREKVFELMKADLEAVRRITA